MNKLFKLAAAIMGLGFLLIIIISVNMDYQPTPKFKDKTISPTPAPTKSEIVIYDLHNGNYISGIDFKEGVYDITSSGTGNVITSNQFTGGCNLISPNEAKNIKLPKGTELKIMGIVDNLNVHMVKK